VTQVETPSRQLVICGMHRSATSLVASVLAAAGLDIGGEVSSPGLGNPRGHFEDPDFYRLHEEMLAAAGRSCFTVDGESLAAVAAGFERRARALVERRAGRPLWGWKDPRTCLFLELWDRVLPQAGYLFLYRHPVDVLLSLWRRDADLELRRDPWLGVHAWETYNRRLLEFRDRHPERCFLAQVPALSGDLAGLVRRVGAKLGLQLDASAAAALLVAEELAPRVPASGLAWERLIPGALALYRRLEESADLPARAAPPTAGGEAAHDGRGRRERQLLRASETLLYALLEHRAPAGPPPPLNLRQAYTRLRTQEEAAHELRAALADERARRRGTDEELKRARARAVAAETRSAELSRVLTAIESSRTFTLVRVWWWLRRRLRPTV
jgi:hypothetical protein